MPTRRRRRRTADHLVTARQEFGELLLWHLKRGTRPPGTPAVNRRAWLQTEFADAVRGVNAGGTSADRSVRNWCSGRTAPDALRPIELALFGREPEGVADQYADFRNKLRLAFQRAKGGIEPVHQDTLEKPASAVNCADPGQCFGRELEIGQLVGAILADPEGGSVLVLGNGGHGKTMLARAAAIRGEIVGRFGARRWFVELERAEGAEAALAEIAQTLGLARTEGWHGVRAALEDRQNPGLLLLDNLETPLHAPRQRLPTEQLLRDLVALPGLSVVATLRSQETVGAVAWHQVMVVEPLAPGPAKAMFLATARTIGMADPDLDFFLGEEGELGGIPLAIHMVAHRVFRNTSLAALKREWRERGALSARLPGGEDARSDSLVASVEFSLHSKRLKAEGKRLFSLLGQLPAGLSEADADRVLGLDSREGAAQLRAIGLLRDMGAARIGLLPPIRDVACRLHPPDPELAAAWPLYFLDVLKTEAVSLGKPEGKASLPRLVAEMPNVAAAMRAIAHDGTGMDQAIAIVGLFENAMDYTGFGGEAALETLMIACGEAGEWVGQGKCLFIIGEKARQRGENATAKTAFSRALECLDGTEAYREAGLCYWGLAEMSLITGGHEESQRFYGEARRRFEIAGWRAGEADCISGLASIADHADDYAAAMALYEEASRVYRDCGSIRSQGDCLWYMAEMERMRERYEEATRLFEAAHEIYATTGRMSGEADCFRGLARLAVMQGDIPSARALLDGAREVRQPDAAAEADFLLCLAEVERYCGELTVAETFYSQALAYFRSSDFLRCQADALFGLGAVAQMRDEIARSKGFYADAMALYQRLGGLIGPANCLSALADIAQASDQEAARRLISQAADYYARASAEAGAERCREKEQHWATLKSQDEGLRGRFVG